MTACLHVMGGIVTGTPESNVHLRHLHLCGLPEHHVIEATHKVEPHHRCTCGFEVCTEAVCPHVEPEPKAPVVELPRVRHQRQRVHGPRR